VHTPVSDRTNQGTDAGSVSGLSAPARRDGPAPMPPPSTVLACRNLTRTVGVHPLFEELSLGFLAGARAGIIGPNGSGKSTLLRLLAGLDEADAGTIDRAQGLRMVYVSQTDRFEDGDTPEKVLESALAASQPHLDEHERQIAAAMALDQAGFGAAAPTDAPVERLSGGWRKRLALLRALIQQPDLLLLDEPTNHLDIEGIWWLEGRLAAFDGTVLTISHDRFFLERVCTRIIEINKLYPGGVFASEGGYSAFLEKRAEFAANQRRQQESLENRMRREIAWLRSNPAAQMRKSKARIDAAGDLQSRLDGLRFRNNQGRSADIDFTASGRRANDLVSLEGVTVELGGRTLFSEVDLALGPGERLGMLGLNGSGKTTLLRVLAGQLTPKSGRVRRAHELRTVIFDQKRERLDPTLSLRRALCPTGETVIYRGRGIAVAAWAKRFLFHTGQLEQTVGALSGGEQARVLLANLMLQEADLLILDEPTNDLDIPTLEVLEDSLLEFPGAVVLVTHDRYLLDRVSTRILALDGQGSAFAVADCAQWEDLAERIQAARNAPVSTKAAPAARSNTAGGLSKNERRELERLPEKIQTAEAAIAALDARMAEPAVISNTAETQRLWAEREQAQTALGKLYARWEDLESRSGG
jgi:ATP-binding cassette subfamily F protein uup